MANENLARIRQRLPEASERDYQSFCAALGSSERGRVFLAEYARRNRNADTEVLLSALERLEAQMRRQGSSPDAEQRLRRELLALHDAIRAARSEIDANTAAQRTSQLVALIESVERNIAALVSGRPGAAIDTGKLQPQAADVERLHLAVVAPLDEPELPIPTPANDVRSIALVANPAATKTIEAPVAAQPARRATIPELDYFDNAAPAPTAAPAAIATPSEPAAPPAVDVATVSEPAMPASMADAIATATFTAEIEFPPPAAVMAKTAEAPAAKPAISALSAIMALSEVERLALFT